MGSTAEKEVDSALLDVLNAILLAHGNGPDCRLSIAKAYYVGRQRRNVVLEELPDRIVVRFERPSAEEKAHGNTKPD